jgi:flagellar basal-body rod protein FlgG
MHGNGRLSGLGKRMLDVVGVVILVWATQTLQHRWDVAHADLYQPAAANSRSMAPASKVLVGLDAHDYDTQLNVVQGSLQSTNRPMDVAIQGNGYFAIKMPGGIGTAYTRSGNFFINSKNEIVVGLGEGYRLDPPIIIPTGTTTVSFGADGTLEVQHTDGSKLKIGQLQLSLFRNPELLRPLGKHIYQPTNASGPAKTGLPGEQNAGLTEQGFLEELNADPVTKLVTQNKTQRAS